MTTRMLRALSAAAMAGLLALSLPAPARAAGAAADGPGFAGTVTNQLTGVPVSGAGITIQHRDGSGWNFTNSDAEGRFVFPDAAGEYVVSVLANGYVEQWLNGHQNQWEADTITAPATLQIPLMPIRYGTVAGKVVSQQGKPIENVRVELRRNSNSVAYAATDSRGLYRFQGVESGPGHTAEFAFPSGQSVWNGGAVSQDSATPFTVAPETTTTVDLTRPPVGHLTIRAIDSVTRQPVVNYCFYPQDGPLNFYTTCTDAFGRAMLRNLPVGRYSGGGYDPNQVYSNGHFGLTTVTEGQTAQVTVRLEKSVSLTVTFVDAGTGDPVEGACVTLADPVRNDIGYGGHCGSVVKLNNLFASERFRLFVAPYDGQHGAQWVSATGGGTGDPALARVYQPTSGEQIGVTVRLDGAGSVTGFLRDSGTSAGVRSVCPSPTGPASSYGSNPTASCTEADGEYVIRNLGPYQWKLAFPAFDGQHASVWSGGGANRTAATGVQVVAGETTVLDVALPATGAIEGTVTVPPDGCVRCTTLVAKDAVTGDYVGTSLTPRADGTFSMKGFNTQDVRLFYSVQGDLVEYPTLLHTTVGGTVTGVDITIPAS